MRSLRKLKQWHLNLEHKRLHQANTPEHRVLTTAPELKRLTPELGELKCLRKKRATTAKRALHASRKATTNVARKAVNVARKALPATTVARKAVSEFKIRLHLMVLITLVEFHAFELLNSFVRCSENVKMPGARHR